MEAMRLYLRSRGIVVGDKVIDTGICGYGLPLRYDGDMTPLLYK